MSPFLKSICNLELPLFIKQAVCQTEKMRVNKSLKKFLVIFQEIGLRGLIILAREQRYEALGTDYNSGNCADFYTDFQKETDKLIYLQFL